jgi:hypothetical protein
MRLDRHLFGLAEAPGQPEAKLFSRGTLLHKPPLGVLVGGVPYVGFNFCDADSGAVRKGRADPHYRHRGERCSSISRMIFPVSGDWQPEV